MVRRTHEEQIIYRKECSNSEEQFRTLIIKIGSVVLPFWNN